MVTLQRMRPPRSLRLFRRSISWWAVAALAILVVIGGLVLVVRDEPRSYPTVSMETIEVGDAPQDVAVGGFSTAWVVNGGDRSVQPISPPMEPGAELGAGPAIRIQPLPGGIAASDDAVWVGAIEGNEIHRLDPSAPKAAAVQAIEVGETPQALAVGEEGVWAASFDDGSIWKIPLTGERDAESFELEGAFPSDIATGFGSVWITDVVDNTLIRMDELTGAVTQEIPVGDSPTAVAVGEGGVWVANFNDATITHIDPETNEKVGQPIIVGARPGGIAAGVGFVWVTRPEDNSVIRIDPIESEWTGEVFDVGNAPQGIATGAGAVWTADQASDTVTRLTLRSDSGG